MIIINEIDFLIRKVNQGYISWNAYDGQGTNVDGTPKKLVASYQGIDPVQSIEELNSLNEAMQPGSKVYFIFSNETNSSNGLKNPSTKTSNVVYMKKSQAAQVGNDPYNMNRTGASNFGEFHPLNLMQIMNQSALEHQRAQFEMMQEIKELKTATKPGYFDAIIEGVATGKINISQLINQIKGGQQPVAVQGMYDAPINTEPPPSQAPQQHEEKEQVSQEKTVQETFGLSDTRRELLEHSIANLLAAEPKLPEILNGLTKFLQDESQQPTWQMIKNQLLELK